VDELERLEIIKAAAWDLYDAKARFLPDCEHGRAWTAQGRGRPPWAGCSHHDVGEQRLAWQDYLIASRNLEALTGFLRRLTPS